MNAYFRLECNIPGNFRKVSNAAKHDIRTFHRDARFSTKEIIGMGASGKGAGKGDGDCIQIP